jgi:hypothetical protein
MDVQKSLESGLFIADQFDLFKRMHIDAGLRFSVFNSLGPAFFRWMLYERLNLLILGSFALPITVVGLLRRTSTLVPISLLMSSVVYVCTFQGGNVQHEYYQILILPTIAMFTGMGASFMYEHAHGLIGRITAVGLIVGLLIGGWIFSWDKVHHYYYSLSDIPQFATIVQTFVKPDEKIVVDTAGGNFLRKFITGGAVFSFLEKKSKSTERR